MGSSSSDEEEEEEDEDEDDEDEDEDDEAARACGRRHRRAIAGGARARPSGPARGATPLPRARTCI